MQRLLTHLIQSLILLCMPGCALITGMFNWLQVEQEQIDSPFTQSLEARGGNKRDIIQMEILFAQRPIGDPLLQDILWENLDEIGPLDLDHRRVLNEAGIRVGVAGSRPPRTLEHLLVRSQAGTGQNTLPAPRKIPIVVGTDTFVHASPLYRSATVRIPKSDGYEVRTLNDCRFVFRVKSEQLEPGWIELEFIPEIHYGNSQLRHTATSDDWKLQSRQEVVPLYRQSFHLQLNTGELAVLSSIGDDKTSIGHNFFIGSGPNQQAQRVLVLKIADIRTVNGVIQ